MNICVMYPSAKISVADVASGLVAGLKANGETVIPYYLPTHLESSSQNLKWLYDKKQADGVAVEMFTPNDVFYDASKGILERALRYDCEWVVYVSMLGQHPDYIRMLRRAGRKVALICTEAPYQSEQELKVAAEFDHVFVNERSVLAQYRAVNPNTTYLGAAWHPNVHQPNAELDVDMPSHDVVFVGTGFPERIVLLENIEWRGVDFGLYGTWELIDGASPLWSHFPVQADGTKSEVWAVPNPVTAALYRNAKVGLNLHRTAVDYDMDTLHVEGAESMNPRGYELAACGLPFVSDWRPEVAEIFGDALPTFHTATEAGPLVRKVLDSEAWRADIAGRCRERIQAHSWTARAGQVLETFSRALVAA